ncbi:PDDEXK nuclease domain-containing protein [Desulfosarcina sp. OttesenSCG-928-A07]|nr:PDDEXK nuclease domain-containing protein [Desulfosarcina sp. OttesenSCG-928-A07]
MKDEPTFSGLIQSIQAAHREMAAQAGKAVNISLTLRNWLIGHHIAEYEMNGKDRAEYGENLLHRISTELLKAKVTSCGKRQLYGYFRFYQTYPQIVETLSPQFKSETFQEVIDSRDVSRKVRSVTALFEINPQWLVSSLSYTHFEQLVAINDSTKRAFYETECVRGNWSVRELKRQIGSLYYERSGLSLDKKKLSALTQQNVESQPDFNIRDPYVFEFLGLKPAEVMSESHLEQQLAEKLQGFLLELGHGFCFEARQKRILIGNEHFFVDLVFYHRILKCHVLVELKLEQFSHENLGQLNTYVSWYRKNMMTQGDNPPVGILLCTDKNQSLVEYALAGMDNHLFVSKYLLELPTKEEMQRFIDAHVREQKT